MVGRHRHPKDRPSGSILTAVDGLIGKSHSRS
jgi:hypothetical protein